MNRSVEILIHNDISEIAVVRDALEQLGNEFSVPMRAITQLQVALDEVVSNVVKYSWPDDEKHKLLVRITVDAAGVVLDLSLIHISEPTRQAEISYAVFCL